MRIIFYIIWLVILSILQPTAASAIRIFLIAPNLFLCFVVLSGTFRGKYEGAVCGAAFGLVYDLILGRLIGMNCLIYSYLGFAAGMFGEHFLGGGKGFSSVLAALSGTIVSGIIYYFAYKLAYGNISFVTAFFRVSLPEAVYNAVMTFLLSFPVLKTMKLTKTERIL